MTRKLSAALALACALSIAPSALLVQVPAFATEVVTGPIVTTPVVSAVTLPWGDWIVAIAQPVFALLSTLIAGLVVGLISKFAPWLSTWITKVQIEGALGRIEAYGLNATMGALKGKTLSVKVGTEALAKMVQYGADSASPLIIKAAGGLPGLAEKLFRRMDLEEGASAATVLAPVKDQIAAGVISKRA